jgi:UPF0716 family protein affecting phage T7 exclusion
LEKRFQVLRIMGTLWKVLAWITLIVGVLSSLGILLVGILGSGGFVLRYFGQDPGVMPGAMSAVSGIVGFIAGLVATIIYFLILFAIGELIFLLLAIEENTRLTADRTEYRAGSRNQVQ